MDPDNITPTFGAGLIGCLGMMGLYGVTSVQTYIYFAFYPDDGPGLKSLVWLIWILDSLHIALVCHGIYHYLITFYGDTTVLDVGVWSLWVSIIVNCMIGCVVQTFFTARLYLLSNRRTRIILIPIIALFVTCHLAFGLETAAWGLKLQYFSKLLDKIWFSALPFAIFAVASDILIAGALCVTLHKNKSYLMTTNNLINYLMIFAINRCLLTATVAIVEVILFAVFPNALWYLGLDFVIGKLYANSLLATLNTRYSLRARAQGASSFSSAGAPSLRSRVASRSGGAGAGAGGGGRAAMFSTVIQVGASIDGESILGDRSLDERRSKSPQPKSRPMTPLTPDSGVFEMDVV